MERENFTRDKANKDIGSQEAAIKDTTRAALLKHLKTIGRVEKFISREIVNTGYAG